MTLNGLIAVVIADLIVVLLGRWIDVAINWRPERLRLRSSAFHAFVLVATLPILLLAAVNSHLSAVRQESAGGARLQEAVAALQDHVGEYLADHIHAVRSLAVTLSDPALDASGRAAHPRRVSRDLSRLHHPLRRRPIGHRSAHLPAAGSGIDDLPSIGDRQYFLDAVRLGAS